MFGTHTPRRAIALGVAAAFVLLTAAPAAAHVSANPREAPAGGRVKLDFRVGHDCSGSPTVRLRVQIPEGVTSVRPQILAGWEIEVVTEELAEPLDDGHGGQITERVSEVSWTGGPLSGEHFADFGLAVRMPEGDHGTKVYFPAIQECVDGEHAWIQIPEEGADDHDLDSPAPAVTLVAAGGGHGASSSHASGDDAAESDEAGTVDDTEKDLAASTGAGGGTDAVSVIALVVGLVALLAGVTALVRARPGARRS